MGPKYRRIMLKLSGEVLLGKKEMGIDFRVLHELGEELIEIKKMGVQVAVVIGGGNFWRWRDHLDSGIDRTTSDSIGMLATIVNAIAMQSSIENQGAFCRVCSALTIPQVAEPYLRRKALRHLEKGRIVILAGGTGSPYFTTDSAAALRALELDCEVFLKATKVPGVYDKDPQKFKNAKLIKEINFTEVLEKDLKVIDSAAVSLCRDSKLPIVIFEMKKGNIKKAVLGEKIGTRIE